jgi:hypothetical protein
MKCRECRWWFPLQPAHDRVGWKNCLALPYPTCMETFMHEDAKCVVPEKFMEKEHEHSRLHPGSSAAAA